MTLALGLQATRRRLAARCAATTPAVVALLLARAALHGVLAWLVWLAGENFWAPLSEICGSVLPASLFALFAFGAAWRATRALNAGRARPLPAEAMASGWRFAGARRPTIDPAAGATDARRVRRGEIAWQLLWPATPWRLLTWPVSLDDWWCIETPTGRRYFRRRQDARRTSGTPDAASQRTAYAPFAFRFPWQIEVALFLALFFEGSLRLLLVPYAAARIGWIIRCRRRQAQWRRVRLDEAAVPAPASTVATSAASAPSAAEAARPRVGDPLLAALTWPARCAPLRPWRQLDGIRRCRRHGAAALGRGAGWLLLRLPQWVGQALRQIVDLWRTLLLTLLGWSAALLISLPPSLLLADPQSHAWREAWQVRAVLWRYGADEAARQATAMLEKAQAASDPAATLAVLRGGAVDGVFRLLGWQSDRRQAQDCRDAVAQAPGVVLQLDETVDLAQLLRETACPGDGSHLQSALLAAAFARSGGHLPIHAAVSNGDPELLPLAIDGDGVLETRDWQGRTPLLLALDLAASAGARRAGWLAMAAELVARGADAAAVDHGGRSAAYLAAQAGLAGDRLTPYLRAATATADSALGATLVHAAAASGNPATLADVVRAGADPAQRTHDGRSALHFAHRAAMVEALYRRGLDPDLRDARGRLPLHAAIIAGDGDAALALLRITLAPQSTDRFGRTPADYLPPAARDGGDATAAGGRRLWNELAWQLAERTGK